MKYKEIKYLLGLAMTLSLVGCSIFTAEPVTQTPPPSMYGGTHAQLLGIDPEDDNNSSNQAEDSSHNQTDSDDSSNNNSNTSGNDSNDDIESLGDTAPDTTGSDSYNEPESVTNNKGDAEGTFTTKDFAGNTVTQEIFTKSKLNVVNVWGTYCGYCIEEMPDLGELASEYDTDEVQFIGIVCDIWEGDDTSYAQSIVNQTGADYLHLLSNYSIYDWKINDVEYIPQTFLIDENGNTIDIIDGMLYKDEWIDVIEYYTQ